MTLRRYYAFNAELQTTDYSSHRIQFKLRDTIDYHSEYLLDRASVSNRLLLQVCLSFLVEFDY